MNQSKSSHTNFKPFPLLLQLPPPNPPKRETRKLCGGTPGQWQMQQAGDSCGNEGSLLALMEVFQDPTQRILQ